MQLSKLLGKVAITNTGAIILGENIVVDGYSSKPLRVVTHIHGDHVLGIEKSVQESIFIAATPLTLDLIDVLYKPIPSSKKLPIPYGVSVGFDDEKVTLVKSNHIPGSAQVLVEASGGERLGYTGDFKLPGTPPMEDLDVLVVDATYGREEWTRPWQEEIEYILADVVQEALTRGPVHIYGYQGKLQEVMLLLRAQGISAPFIATRKVYLAAKIMVKHGYPLQDIVMDGTPVAREAKKQQWYVYFDLQSAWRTKRYNGIKATRILLTGWEFTDPYRRLGEREWIISFSDHADYNQLMEYISEAKPRLVVVDGYRGGATAEAFARSVRRKLGIPALSLP